MLIEKMDCGGAETHILALSTALLKRGNYVCVVSGGGKLVKKLLQAGVAHVTLPLCSHSLKDIICSYFTIHDLVKSGNFDVVHSHSRIASLLSHYIAGKFEVPFITTVHAHFRTDGLRRKFSRWGSHPIAVSEDLMQYLVENYDIPPENISVIHNGIDKEKFSPAAGISEKIRILFLSRLDADCSLGAELLCKIAPEIAALYPDIEVLIGGGGSEYKRICGLAKDANNRIGKDYVICVGAVDNTAGFFTKGHIFVGVSRAAVEAAFCGLSVIICGNEGYAGHLCIENFKKTLSSNFCARDGKKADEERLKRDILKLIPAVGGVADKTKSDKETLFELLDEECSSDSMASATEQHYRRAIKLSEAGGGVSLLCGYYGFKNMGDDMMLRASAERVRREYGGTVHALTRRGGRDSENFCMRCFDRSSFFTIIREIKNCDRLVFGGGTLLQNSTSRRSLIYYAALIFLAHAMEKDCILLGNGLGKISGGACRILTKKVLGCCDIIEMRDKRSYFLAKYMLHEGTERVKYVRDMGECEREIFERKARVDFLLSSCNLSENSKFIVVVPFGNVSDESVYKMVRELRDKKTFGRKIIAVPMCEAKDGKLCNMIAKKFGAKVLRGICFDDLVGILRSAEALYSMRYHALVAAHIAGCEMWGIGSDSKIVSYCRENGGHILE